MDDRLSYRARSVAALLGTAIGDALGWPQEQSSHNTRREPRSPEFSFRSWCRRSGGRFQPYEETIAAGEYSDDTQLTLAVGRSLVHGDGWFDYLTGVELPAWSLYERGGGRSVLRAAASWSANRPPWTSGREADSDAYFRTGANGVAMRILPHVIIGAQDPDFSQIGSRIVRDGCATHGHAVALVGALLHGFNLWSALRLEGPLGYGELLDRAQAADDWRSFDAQRFPDGWLGARRQNGSADVETEWQTAVKEALGYLDVARRGMESGPLATDDEVLHQLHVFDRKINGSGTISAVVAAFIASRSAANPPIGLLEVAFLRNADTDTLAAMTAGLLGAVGGSEWMGALRRDVQDASYIEALGHALSADAPRRRADKELRARLPKGSLDRWTRELERLSAGEEARSPDGRQLSLVAKEQLLSKTPKIDVTRYSLRTIEGQTIFVTRVRRPKTGQGDQGSLPVDNEIVPDTLPATSHIAVKICVSNLSSSRYFYEQVLRLTPTRSGETYVTYGESFALAAAVLPATRHEPEQPSFVLHLETPRVDLMYKLAAEAGITIVDAIGERHGRPRFSCLDPDGNVVEVVAPNGRRLSDNDSVQ